MLGQTPGIRVQQLFPDDGLSQSTVNSIHQDSRGYIWFGTADGLNRFDGYDIKVYRYDPNLRETLSDNYIRCMTEDHRQRLWIGTDVGGLNYLDLVHDDFHQIPLYLDSTQTSQARQIWDLYLDEDEQQLWVATWNGLFTVNLSSDVPTATHISTQAKQLRRLTADGSGNIWIGTENFGVIRYPEALPPGFIQTFHTIAGNNRIQAIEIDDSRTVWIGTKGRLIEYHPESNKIFQYPYQDAFGEPDEVMSLKATTDNTLWVGTSSNGLIQFDRRTKSQRIHVPLPNLSWGLSASAIFDIYIDGEGLLWLGTNGDGVQYFDPHSPFKYYHHRPQDNNSLSNNSVRAIITDKRGNLWVGSYGGLDRFNRVNQTVRHYNALNTQAGGPFNPNVYSVTFDLDSNLWIGTEGGGLYRMDHGTDFIYKPHFDYGESGEYPSIESEMIFELFTCPDSGLLIGTNTGLFHLPRRNNYAGPPEKIELETTGPSLRDDADVLAIVRDAAGQIWIGTDGNGLYTLNSDYSVHNQYQHSPNDRYSLSNNRIKSLFIDRHDQLWIGTNGGGLNMLDAESGQILHYNQSDGLADNTIYGILADTAGRLWLSTNNGISLFDTNTDQAAGNFGVAWGLQNKEFNTGAYYQAPDGEMFFGGIGGLTAFYPDRVYAQLKTPGVTLTDFRLENMPVAIGHSYRGNILLPKDIGITKALHLSYREEIVSIAFSSMNFLTATTDAYRYKLEGLNDDWVYTHAKNRMATFTNLPAGEYIFAVQSRHASGVNFGPAQELLITVSPPPWKSWWAYGIYVLILGGVLFALRQNEIKKIRLQNELKRKQEEATRLNEIDQMKSRLIANVSHELRTPLTLLDNHIDELTQTIGSEIPSPARKSLKNVKSSLVRVNDLSNQLFELSRFAAGKVRLKASPTDINARCHELGNEFRHQLSKHDLAIEIRTPETPLVIYLDQPKFEQIVLNLLSNAQKFSTPGSAIRLEVLDDRRREDRGLGSFVIVRVSNTGPGIESQAIHNVFDRLFQVDSSDMSEKSGAGIGLALVKELVELHGGTIHVESTPGEETVFEFTLPKGAGHLSPDEKIVPEKPEQKSVQESVNQPLVEPGGTRILVVEDDAELRQFVCDNLSELYAVSQASNGKAGYELACEFLPDLIVSDVVMPGGDGLELLEAVRADAVLAHVPVIFLTAQSSGEDRLQGYAATANDYIVKPFKIQELRIRIANILEERRKLMEIFREKELPGALKQVQVGKADEKFYQELKQHIFENLDQNEFSVDQLAKTLFMSKRQLERKLKDLTGYSPAEFIRRLRLTQAEAFLREGTFTTVAEVAYAVGFRNVKYFSRLFFQQFGKHPSDLLTT
ncbi:MAG: response regulator [Lentisphaeria bacterium]|nr:response regulator [Lentisphaeria bacterium]